MSTHVDEKSPHEHKINLDHLEAGKVNSSDPSAIQENDFHFTFGKFLAVLSFQLGYFSDIFILIASAALLSTINKDIGPDPNYTWIATGGIIGTAIVAPFVGRLGDIFGRRPFLVLANVLGMIGCAISATTHSINVMIGGSVLIGCGSAMHQMSWACLSEIVPRRMRPVALGLLQTSIGPASAFGPLIAYACVANSSWRAVYWISFAIYSAALALVFFFYRPINQHIRETGKTKWAQALELDYIGLFLWAAGLVLFLLGISFGGHNYPWKSPPVISMIVIGIALLVVCGFWEAYNTSPYALFPRNIMGDVRGFTVVLGVIVLVGMLYYSTPVLWPEQVQILYTTNLYTLGLYTMAFGLGGTVFGPPAGWIVKNLPNTRNILVVFTLGTTLFSGLMAVVSPGSKIASVIIVTFVGCGVAAATVASNAMIVLAIPHEYVGVAIGLATTARSVGGSVATTIYTVILSHSVENHLGKDIATALAKTGLPLADVLTVTEALVTSNMTSSALKVASPLILQAGSYALKLSYSRSFRLVYLVSITFGVLGAICSFFTKDIRQRLTAAVDIKLEEGAHIVSHADNTGGHIIHLVNSNEVGITTEK